MRFEILAALTIFFILPSCQPSKEASKPPVRLGPGVGQMAAEVLAPLEGTVSLELTLGGDGETVAEEVLALADLVDSTSANVSVNRIDISAHPDPVGLGVTHGPVIEMKGKAPGTLRYYGYPERKETRPFLEGILTASGHQADLAPDVVSFLSVLGEDILIRIFTTPD